MTGVSRPDPAHIPATFAEPARDAGQPVMVPELREPVGFMQPGLFGPNDADLRTVAVTVPGRPAPQGSKSAQSHCGQSALVCNRCKRPHIVKINQVEKSKYLKEWRRVVAVAAAAVMRGQPPMTGAVAASMVFALDRPKNHYYVRKTGSVLRDDAPTWPVYPPDLSKLARATEDALTGVVWGDDAQVVAYDSLRVVWAQDSPAVPLKPPQAGVTIVVRQIAG